MEDSHVTVSSGCSPTAKIPKIEEISDKPAQRSEESPKKDRVEMELLNQKNETHDHEEPSSSSSQTVSIPPLPSNSFQLEADLRKPKNHPGTMYKYLKQIKVVKEVIGLSKQHIIRFLHICTTIGKTCLSPPRYDNPSLLLEILKNLSNIRRFDMAVMFMSSAEKKVVKDIFEHLHQAGFQDASVAALKKMYGV
ncbi:RNA polymerase II-associated protein 3 [Arapaima gigas]